MELSLANMPPNDRVRTVELELPGGESGSQAEPGHVSEHDGDRVRLEEAQSEFIDRLHEIGTAELEDDQFPRPIQHQVGQSYNATQVILASPLGRLGVN